MGMNDAPYTWNIVSMADGSYGITVLLFHKKIPNLIRVPFRLLLAACIHYMIRRVECANDTTFRTKKQNKKKKPNYIYIYLFFYLDQVIATEKCIAVAAAAAAAAEK